MRTAVLGAGISGLTLARLLDEDGVDVHVFESADRAGGLCLSETVDGWTTDVSGGHILFSRDQEVFDWEVEVLGGRDACVWHDRETRIRWMDPEGGQGRFIPYPFENGIGSLPDDALRECLSGLIDATTARRAGAPEPGLFGDWIEWRFGAGIVRHFMRPYNEKVWSVDLAEMGVDWVSGRVPDAPVEDILKAAVGPPTVGYAHQAQFAYPREGGFGALPDAVGAPVMDRVRLRTPAVEVRRVGERWAVNGEDFDHVVSTIPLPILAAAMPDLHEEARALVGSLRSLAITTVLLGLSHDEVPPLSWIYLPFPGQGPTNRVTVLSNYSPNNAPEGCSSFLCEVTSDGQPRDDPELVADVKAGIEAAGLASKDDVVAEIVRTCNYAYILFDPGSERRIPEAVAAVEATGIDLLGRFARYEYDNSDVCIAKARALHARLRGQAQQG